MGQVDDEAVGLLLHAADDHQGLAKVALGVARRMGQRHEHLLGLTAILSDVVLDRGVSAVESVFVPETPEVVLQDPVDDASEGLQFGPLGRTLSPVPRRDRIGQHLAHGVPVQPKLSGDLPNTLTLHHHRPANPQIYLYLEHPSHHPWGRIQPLWMAAGGPICNRRLSEITRPHGTLYLRRLHPNDSPSSKSPLLAI